MHAFTKILCIHAQYYVGGASTANPKNRSLKKRRK